jgi:hypothetical protein
VGLDQTPVPVGIQTGVVTAPPTIIRSDAELKASLKRAEEVTNEILKPRKKKNRRRDDDWFLMN